MNLDERENLVSNSVQKLSSLTIFFPAYNEAANIATTVTQALRVVETITTDYEILVIDDGSSDDTTKIVKEFESNNPKIKLISHPHNMGYGAALITGFKNATKDWTFFSDGDGQFDLTELTDFVRYTNDYDVIIGYRKTRNDHLARLLNAKGWNLLNQLFFGLKVKDIDCAFKLFRTSTIQSVIQKTQSFGAMISAEMLIRLHREGYQFQEIPVTHYSRKAGSATGAKPQVILRAFREMAWVYRGDLGPDWMRQVSYFMVLGIISTFSDLALYFFLSRSIPGLVDHLTWAKGLSYAISLVSSSSIRILFSRSPSLLVERIMRLTLLGIAALSINTSIMFVLYNNLATPEWLALFTATVLTFLWTYLSSFFLVQK